MMKNKLRFNNTYNSGSVTILILQETKKFTAVCLEFDLVVQSTTPKEAQEKIVDYAKAWYENVVKNKLPETLLNKPAPKKFWRLYERARLEEEARMRQTSGVTTSKKPVIRCYQPYSPQFPLAFA